MLQLLSSTADTDNPDLTEGTRRQKDNNVAWLERQLKLQALTRPVGRPTPTSAPIHVDADESGSAAQPADESNTDGTSAEASDAPPTHVLLVGGSDQTAFRLRMAQAHLRDDLWPSHWSHAALLGPIADDVVDTELFEISLDPSAGFVAPAKFNGLQASNVGRYRDTAAYPNIAILRLEVPLDAWYTQRRPDSRGVLDLFQRQRAVLDAPELILTWLAFVWGVGRSGNPLFDGNGVPSAAMIEVILSGVGFDISPGLDSRVSSPESFWQAAKWWHTYYEGNRSTPIIGKYVVHNRIDQQLFAIRTPRQDRRAPSAPNFTAMPTSAAMRRA